MPPAPGSARSESQQPLRVAASDSFLVSGAHWQPIKEGTRLGHRSVGIVRGEHDPICTDLEQEVEERGRPVEAAEGVVDVLPEVRADWTVQAGQLRRQRSL